MKKLFTQSIFVIATGLFAANTFAQPVITTFSPASGAIGNSVTITGTGFNATAGQNIVFFGATKATVTAASTTSLTVTVPLGATYQYISVTNLAVNLTAYSAQPFIVTLAGNILFNPKQDFTTGNYPYLVSIGDIDGDGKSDLAVANLLSNTVSVLRNTSTSGTVSFATKVDFATGASPGFVSIGDIDGDGKPDLAVTNLSSNTVSVLRSTSTSGTVSFAAKVDFTTGAAPYSVSIGDIDGNGKPDLAVANTGSTTVSVLRSTSTSGTVSFAAKVDFTAGSNPYSVSIGDVDGDGKPDLAVANQGSNTISVLRSTSTSGIVSFAAKVDFTTGASPYSVSIGDIDGDGKPDLAVANTGSNSVSVLRSTSTSGTVSFATKVDFTTGTQPYSVSIGDMNGDGKPDLAVANQGSNTVSVLRGTSTSGTVSFATKVDFTTGADPISVSIGDIDGDGKPDLAVANRSDNTISVIRQILPPPPTIISFSPANGAIGSSVIVTGTGFNATAAQNIVFFGATQAAVTAASPTSLTVTVPLGATYQYFSVTNLEANSTAYSAQPFIVTLAGNIAFTAKQDFTTGAAPFSVGIGDIDGDGKPDLAVVNQNSNTVSVLRSTSTSGTVSFAAKVDFATGTIPSSVSIGDIDGDGKPDLAVTNQTNTTVSVLRNTSTSGTVSFAAKVDFATGTQPFSVSIGDVDGDGKPDLAVVNYSSNTVSVLRSTSTSGAISFATKVDFATGTSPTSVSIGDIDGDGKLDLAVANNSSATVSVLRSTSTSGTVSFVTKVDFTSGASPYAVSIGDIDGDGNPDLAVANYSSNSVSVFRSTSTSGTVSFAAKVDFITGAGPISVNIGDIDGDGKPDLAVANHTSNTVSVLRSTSSSGTVSFATKVDATTGLQPISARIGDIDGDGKPDLGVANVTSNSVSVIRQVVPPPAITTLSPSSGAIGSSVNITGSGFNATAGQNIVFFGATQAAVTAASATSLTVTVPLGATYQHLSITNLAVNLTAYSAQPFIVTLAGNIAFANKVDFAAGTLPRSVSIGDIDGDGKTDLAVANGSGNTVSVFRNTSSSGTVSFAPKVDFATGGASQSVSIGDIDGDGKPDLAVANPSSSNVSVLRNTSTSGTVSFAAKVDFATGSTAYSISIGDIDGDGKPDLAVANQSGPVSVFRSTSTSGTISFAAKVDLTAGSLLASVSIGDIDGDGKPDLAVANNGSNNVSVFRSTSTSGAVSFAPKVDFATGPGPYSVSIGDIDVDGNPDLVVANQSGPVSVFRSTSTSGTVSFAAKVDFTTGAGPISVSIGDIDGDGKPDLAVANSGSNTVSVFRNTSTSGTVSFAAKDDFTSGAGPWSVSIGDIDGDGKPDLAVANAGSDDVSVIRQIIPPPPAITSLSPASGAVGTLVTITGTNLAQLTAFTIGGVGAIEVSNTGTTLVGLVMPGAVTGTISVTTAGGTATSTSNFTVTPTPFPSVPQGTKLVGTGASGNATQGRSVSVSADGNTAIVGGDSDALVDNGAAWIYTRTNGLWTQQGGKLVGTGHTDANAKQGFSVSISADGNTVIVGGFAENSNEGAAWVYTRTGGVWTQQGSKLVGTGATGLARQGQSVSLSADGNTALVGGYQDNSSKGAAWVYTRTGGVWAQQGGKLVGTGSTGASSQGQSVSLASDGNTAIVGGYTDNGNTGAVWIYTRTGGVWTQQGNKLVGTGATGLARQGQSVSLSADGNTAIAGGYSDNSNIGAAWVYTRTGGVWAQQGLKLVGTGATGLSRQGQSVSLSADGNIALVGGYGDNSNTGAAWVYSRTAGVWAQQGGKLVGTGATGAAQQGFSVSLSSDGSTAIVGGPNDNSLAGAAWVFVPCIIPAQPGTVTGNATICSGSLNTYSITSVAGATSYTWTMPGGWTGTSTTNSIDATASATSGNISVTANNTCGSSVAQTLTITVNSPPAQPGTITGNATICSGSLNTYSITAVSGATSYTWTMPTGWTGTSTTNSINATASATGGDISVTANNTCGSSTAQTLAITVNSIPAQPGTITGNATICSGSLNTYSITSVVGATSYTWTMPGGWTGTSTTNSIDATASATSGNISVTANNTCGSSVAQTLTITVNSPPAQPGTITGNATICSGSLNTYSITAVSGATSYTWTMPTGWTGTSTTNSINATASATGGDISVTANNTCGSSTAQTLAITVNSIPAQPGTISGNVTICSGSLNTYSITSVVGATSFTWTMPGGWTGTSNTNSINATASTTSGNISVTANNTCGSSAAQTLTIINTSIVKPTIAINNSNPASPILTSSGDTGNQWFLNGTAIGGATAKTHTVSAAGSYQVRVTNGSCVSELSDVKLFIVTGDLHQVNTAGQATVYPNPVENKLFVKLSGFDPNRYVNINLVDGIGRTITQSAELGEKEISMEISHFASGVYFIQLMQGDETRNLRFIKK